tara:strand:+ start:11050 stop:12756 length:1707 start_codon:yes stop_codon:yes gene_type:complete
MARKKTSDLHSHVKYLAADKLEGRYPGSKGGKMAAEYIKKQFIKNNLTLLGEDGFQYFDIITGVELGYNNYLLFENNKYVPNTDYIPLSFGKNINFKGEVSFIGYGFTIENDSIQWNDYEKHDVSDKWVMILRGAPDGNNPHGIYGEHISLRTKAILAKDNSAKGIIFVSGEIFDNDDELIPLTYDSAQKDLGIPIIHMKRDLANKLLKNNNISINKLESKINNDLEKFSGFNLENDLDVQTDVVFKKKITQNVIGFIKGNNDSLNNEYIVIGAHYDHLGYGGDKSGSRRPYLNEIHNGADDNASGVSILLQLSKILSLNKGINRNILFIAFGAEEMGLIGSKYFINSNMIPNEKIQIMINMDMVGRLNNEKNINISGTKTATNLEQKLKIIMDNNKINYTFSSEGYGPSDHSSFYVKNIPVLFFFTGAHTDYHTPLDDYDKLNYQGMKLITNVIHSLTLDFDKSEKLVFNKTNSKKTSRPSKFKVTLGIMPDYVFNKIKGLRIDAVIPNKTADKAGLLSGDVIIEINHKPVSDIYEYMHRLSEINEGETIPIIVIRNNSKIQLNATF